MWCVVVVVGVVAVLGVIAVIAVLAVLAAPFDRLGEVEVILDDDVDVTGFGY
jgi:hypothetical protein